MLNLDYLVAYSYDAILTLLLVCYVGYKALSKAVYWQYLIVLVITMIWFLSVNNFFGLIQIEPRLRLSIEATKTTAWSLLFVVLTQNQLAKSAGKILIASILLTLTAVFVFLRVSDLTWMLWLMVLLNSIAMLTAEQLYRGAENNRLNKLLSITIGITFLVDIYIYVSGLFASSIASINWEIRAAVNLLVMTMVGVGFLIFKANNTATSRISLSKQTIFYTSTLILIGLMISIISISTMYLDYLKSSWKFLIYSVLFVVFSSFIVLIQASKRIRTNVYVQISKHVFGAKYDYKEEWLKLISILNDSENSTVSYRTTALKAMLAITRSQRGALLIKQGRRFVAIDTLGWHDFPDSQDLNLEDHELRLMEQDEWIYLKSESVDPVKHQGEFPEAFDQVSGAAMLIPLVNLNGLYGLILVDKPMILGELTWEDLDLFKTVARQLADYLRMHDQEKRLSENSQLEAFAKFTAFIVHDLNNIIAQQSLLVRNAEKHKTNPDFVNDMVLTVGNSVGRMEKLLEKLKHDGSNTETEVSLLQVCLLAVEKSLEYLPEPTLNADSSDLVLVADKDKLLLSISHLIRNAQDATEDDGEVDISISTDPVNSQAILVIRDTGSGMRQEFINNSLFKPFDTTKVGKGMGLGMYLSKQYIEALGGEIIVESQVDIGTTVTVAIPGKITNSVAN